MRERERDVAMVQMLASSNNLLSSNHKCVVLFYKTMGINIEISST